MAMPMRIKHMGDPIEFDYDGHNIIGYVGFDTDDAAQPPPAYFRRIVTLIAAHMACSDRQKKLRAEDWQYLLDRKLVESGPDGGYRTTLAGEQLLRTITILFKS